MNRTRNDGPHCLIADGTTFVQASGLTRLFEGDFCYLTALISLFDEIERLKSNRSVSVDFNLNSSIVSKLRSVRSKVRTVIVIAGYKFDPSGSGCRV
jgi:hypothetical protein